MLLVARFPPQAGHGMFAMAHSAAVHAALSGPGAMQRDHVIVPVVHVQTGAHGLLQKNGLITVIVKAHTPGDGIRVLKHTVGKHRPKAQRPVPAGDSQSSHFPIASKGGRQARQRLLSLINLMGIIGQKHGAVAPRAAHPDAALPVIPHAVSRVLCRKAVQKRKPVPGIDLRCHRIFTEAHQRGHALHIVDSPAIISMSQKALLVNKANTIGCFRRIKLEQFLLRYIGYSHSDTFPSLIIIFC